MLFNKANSFILVLLIINASGLISHADQSAHTVLKPYELAQGTFLSSYHIIKQDSRENVESISIITDEDNAEENHEQLKEEDEKKNNNEENNNDDKDKNDKEENNHDDKDNETTAQENDDDEQKKTTAQEITTQEDNTENNNTEVNTETSQAHTKEEPVDDPASQYIGYAAWSIVLVLALSTVGVVVYRKYKTSKKNDMHDVENGTIEMTDIESEKKSVATLKVEPSPYASPTKPSTNAPPRSYSVDTDSEEDDIHL